MRLLVDNALSPRVSRGLSDAGHDVIHVRDVGLATASDDEIVDFASQEERIVISADTDFATILALRKAKRPSFILLRGDIERWPEAQTALLLEQLSALEEVLTSGAVIVVTRDRIRIRSLPILPD
jgi:predicted nuclease of predicted toxin-antitoxin system